NIAIERGFGEANSDRLREVAAEVVRREVDIIVALSTTAARPLKQASSVIPIVVVGMADPVEDELVASLARPGGNVPGTSFLGPELGAKRLQLVSEVVPQPSRVAVLWHPRAYGDRTMGIASATSKSSTPATRSTMLSPCRPRGPRGENNLPRGVSCFLANPTSLQASWVRPARLGRWTR